MKKENIYEFLYAVSAFLVIGFAIRFGVDIYKCNTGANSAPLYLFAIQRVIEFIVPSIIVFVTAILVKKKFANKEKNDKISGGNYHE